MNRETLESLKEGNQLEIKKAVGGVPVSLWETYSAFANTSGGTIVLGLMETKSDGFRIVGVPDAQLYIQNIWNTVNNRQKVNKNILGSNSVRLEEIDGMDIIYIDVPRANRTDRPIYLNNDLYGGTYRRSGEGDYHCSSEEVRNMIRDSSERSIDLQCLENFGMEALNLETVARYRRRLALTKPDFSWNQLDNEQFLYRLNAIGKEEGNNSFHPTVAGLLMFGYHYEIVKEFPHYLLDYREVENMEDRWIDRVVSDSGTWSGNLFDFYHLVSEKITAQLKNPFRIQGMIRVDDTPVHAAIREALVNTIVHANYHEQRGLVIIKDPNAFQFANPGSLRVKLEEAINGGISDPRNATVFTMFTLINLGERAGSGLSNIFSIWRKSQWPVPQLIEQFNPDRTILTLRMVDKSADKSADKNIYGKTINQRNDILAYLSEHGKAKTTDICNLLLVKETRAKYILRDMVKDNSIVAEGERKGRTYRLPDKKEKL